MPERRAIRLGDILDISHGYAFPGSGFSDEAGFPTLLTPGNFAIGGGFKSAKTKTFVENYPDLYELAGGDLVVSMTDLSKEGATLGLPAIIPEDGIYLHNQRVGLVLIKEERLIERRFLSYFLRTSDYRSHVLGTATGSTVRHTSPSKILAFQATLPCRWKQVAIAEVLGALDDKIAANIKIVSTLRQLLAAEYDRAVAPGGVTETIDGVAEFHDRRRVPLSAQERELHPGNVPYYGATGRFGSVAQAIFHERLVLVGEDGSVVNADGTPVVQYVWGPSWVNNHAHVLTGKGISTEVLLLAIRRVDVRALVTGAVQPKLNMRNLRGLAVELPAAAHLARIEQVAGSQMASHRNISDENRTLAAMRDALLPHLMSGRLRVRDAEKIVSETV